MHKYRQIRQIEGRIGKIVCETGYSSGSPRVDGTRLTCENIVSQIKSNNLEEFLDWYSYLTLEDIQACLYYCASQKCLEDKPDAFCERCSLDTREDYVPRFFTDTFGIHPNETGDTNSNHVFSGTREDWEESEKPRDVWKEAQVLMKKYNL